MIQPSRRVRPLCGGTRERYREGGKRIMHRFAMAFIVIIITGCAAMGVPVTFDPREKLAWARNLYEEQDRPLPAERLIREAKDIYQSKNDELGLALAYRQYALFLKSRAVSRYEQHYRTTGFYDRSLSFDDRYSKSIAYLQLSKELFIKNAKYDLLTNIDLVMGNIYLSYIGNQKEACKHYDQSLAEDQEFQKQNPNSKINLPTGFDTYEDYILSVKKEAKCP